jgi:hypothetical protein
LETSLVAIGFQFPKLAVHFDQTRLDGVPILGYVASHEIITEVRVLEGLALLFFGLFF